MNTPTIKTIQRNQRTYRAANRLVNRLYGSTIRDEQECLRYWNKLAISYEERLLADAGLRPANWQRLPREVIV